MLLMRQVYAPVDTSPDAFHRTLYVFMHPDVSKGFWEDWWGLQRIFNYL